LAKAKISKIPYYSSAKADGNDLDTFYYQEPKVILYKSEIKSQLKLTAMI